MKKKKKTAILVLMIFDFICRQKLSKIGLLYVIFKPDVAHKPVLEIMNTISFYEK